MQLYTHTSRPGCIFESQELPGRPPSRANDLGQNQPVANNESKLISGSAYQSCLEVVVTPLMEHDVVRIKMTTARNLVAGTESVALRMTAMYG